MKIECDVHSLIVEPLHEAFRIREIVPVPCIAGPAASVLRVNVCQMPVHINDRHGEGDIFLMETVYQFFISLFRVFVKAAPPVAERVAGDHRHFAAQPAEIAQRSPVIMAVCPEVDVDDIFAPGLYPAVIAQNK